MVIRPFGAAGVGLRLHLAGRVNTLDPQNPWQRACQKANDMKVLDFIFRFADAEDWYYSFLSVLLFPYHFRFSRELIGCQETVTLGAFHSPS